MARKRKTKAVNTISLNGKNYPLELNFAALRDIAVHTGIDLLESDDQEDTGKLLNAKNAQFTVWCLIGAEDSGLSAREVGRAMKVEDLNEYVDPILKSFRAGMEDEGEGNAVSVDDTTQDDSPF